MIGLDTNVVVRYLVQDDPQQAAAATRLIDGFTEANPGFVSLVTVVELYWVLNRAYGLTATGCLDLLYGLVHARELHIDQATTVGVALNAARDGADFPDAVIAELGRAAGCDYTATFDRRAARSKLMKQLPHTRR